MGDNAISLIQFINSVINSVHFLHTIKGNKMRSNLLIAITLIAQLIAGNYGTETWSCAAPNAAIAISNVQIAPDPIVYPGNWI